jgi:hypothetical protein
VPTYRQPRDDQDFRRGYLDGRMDALIERLVMRVSDGVSAAYKAGYGEGRQSVRADRYAAA